jgi:hypothetical protein
VDSGRRAALGDFESAGAVVGNALRTALQQALTADRPVVIDVVSDIDALAPVAVSE